MPELPFFGSVPELTFIVVCDTSDFFGVCAESDLFGVRAKKKFKLGGEGIQLDAVKRLRLQPELN